MDDDVEYLVVMMRMRFASQREVNSRPIHLISDVVVSLEASTLSFKGFILIILSLLNRSRDAERRLEMRKRKIREKSRRA